MHDTAFHIGTLAMNIYADLRNDSILEVGSQSVNGSLRENALPTTRYVGLDIEEGEGVDLVVEAGKPFPVEDDSFDLVMATSVFEHDPCFWMTFLEMCRKTKEGGFVYISAPSNGNVHRYPEDNWRFYPDSGKALAKWAVSQGQAITLVESFVADRENDIWNDFVAVFRKGRITKTLPKVFIHEHVPCTNIMTWKSKEVLSPTDAPEDVRLLTQMKQRAETAEVTLAETIAQRDTIVEDIARLNAKLADAEVKLGALDAVRSELTLRENELRQRQEEIEQTRSELTKARTELDGVRTRLLASEQRVELEVSLKVHAEKQMAQAKARMAEEIAKIEADRDRVRLAAQENERRIVELNEEVTAHERRLAAHFHETATLSRIIQDSQQETIIETEKARRIRELYDAVISQPRWWSILPTAHRSRLQTARLRRLDIFDAQSYLRANPDVAAAGEDPVHHYIHHGIDEQRPTDY